MSNVTFADAQGQMRANYLNGAPGALVSGIVWLIAGAVAIAASDKAAVHALLSGGAIIFPVSMLLTKLLGRRGGHDADNPLGRLAMEGTFWMLAGIAVAFALFQASPHVAAFKGGAVESVFAGLLFRRRGSEA